MASVRGPDHDTVGALTQLSSIPLHNRDTGLRKDKAALRARLPISANVANHSREEERRCSDFAQELEMQRGWHMELRPKAT